MTYVKLHLVVQNNQLVFDSVEIYFHFMPRDFKTCFLNHKNDIHLVL